MIKASGIITAIAVTAVAAGTYHGLNTVYPFKKENGTVVQTVSVDSVFSGTPTRAEPLPAPQPPAPAAPAPAPAPQSEATKPLPNAATIPPEASPVASEAEPAPPAKPKAQATAKAAPQKTKPAEKHVETAATAPAPAEATPPVADLFKPWWPDPASMPSNQLKLLSAGPVAGETAIALLFSAPLDLASVNKNVTVKTDQGSPVEGTWELGRNPRLAVLHGVKPGRYTVILDPALTDSNGNPLGTALQGPVSIR